MPSEVLDAFTLAPLANSICTKKNQYLEHLRKAFQHWEQHKIEHSKIQETAWNGVPCLTPFNKLTFTHSGWPSQAATCNGVAPEVLAAFTLAPCPRSIWTRNKTTLAAQRKNIWNITSIATQDTGKHQNLTGMRYCILLYSISSPSHIVNAHSGQP